MYNLPITGTVRAAKFFSMHSLDPTLRKEAIKKCLLLFLIFNFSSRIEERKKRERNGRRKIRTSEWPNIKMITKWTFKNTI